MYFLVRQIVGRERAETLDSEYEADALVLGGDESAMVQLTTAGSLRIEGLGSDRGRIVAGKLSLSLNGTATSAADVQPGDVMELPGYRLQVIAAPAGFDFALQVETVAGAVPDYSAGLDLDTAAWSLRRSSWLALATVLLLCLLLPLLGVVDDVIWSTGPLASAHRTAGIAETCEACHVQPFVMVEDEACLACHRGITEHVSLAGLAESPFSAEHFSGERCGSCHREHNEPPALVRRDAAQCTDCHGSSEGWPGDVEPVHAFNRSDHPEFKLALLRPQGPGAAHGWEEFRVRRDSASLQEQSNLKFPHDVHLDADKVRNTATDAALVCESCHVLENGGEHFEAVSMDAHCRDCHSLSFDIFEPDLELPHGDLRAAVVAMEAHFIREFTDPALRRQRAGSKPRRVPNKRVAAATCEGSGLDCGRAEALKEAEYQFANTGCVSCHVVEETGLTDISDRWFVHPIRLTGDWYPHSRFDHKSHLNLALEEGAELEHGDAVCVSCHEATLSTAATDILIPGRDNCLQCHTEGQGSAAADCVSCHAFHQRGATPAVEARLEGSSL